MNSARTIFRNIAIFIVFVIPFISLAAPLYQPGETLNPACLPTDADCTVATTTSSTSFSTTTNDYWLTQQFSLSNLAGIGSSTGTTFLNGNVGIGTSTSGQYNLLLARATGSATANIQTSDAAGEAAINLENTVRRWKIKATAAASDAFVIRDQTAAADRFVINNVGNVGIGTTSAYAKLSVGSTDTASTTFALRPIASQTANILDVYNTSGTLTSVITAAGNWGIGTSAPAVRLQIGSGYANFDNSYGLTFANAGATDRDIARILYSPSGTLDFYNADAVRMTVGYGGNIGIGTTSPYTKLSVVGDIVATAITATSSFNTSGTTGGYKIDGNLILQASSTNFSTLVGRSAGNALLADGVANTALGYQALITATSSDYNTAVGHSALYANTTGSYNTAQGYRALAGNTVGNSNAATGMFSLYSNTTASNNVANGAYAMYFNTTGGNNQASGYAALYANTTGANNTANGYTALYSNTTGGQNTADGNSSLRYGSTTSGVTAIGYIAGVGPSNIASDYNSLADTNMTFLGASASRDNNNASTTVLTNSTAIGYNAKVGGSNMLVLGNSVNVGIGTTSPLAKLDVLNIAGGTTPLFSIASSTSGAATSTAFYVAANGNVAIGTTTANSKLQISGDVAAAPSSTVYGQLEVTGNDRTKRLSMGFNTTSNYAFIQSLITGNNYYDLVLNPNGASAGNVGISTTTPYAKLSVTNTGTGPSFVVEDSASADATPFIVDASGLVGIGTVPTTFGKLEVSDSATTNSYGVSVIKTQSNTIAYQSGINSTFTSNQTSGAFSGVNSAMNAQMFIGGSNTQNWTGAQTAEGAGGAAAVLGHVEGRSGWSGTVSNAASFLASNEFSSTGGGVVTNLSGFRVMDSVGTLAPVNQYGVYINALTKGSTSDYGLYFGGAQDSGSIGSAASTHISLMPGTSANVGISTTTPYAKLSVTNTGSGPSFIVEDTTSPDSTPFIIDASGNVGIGTSSPTELLSISQSAVATTTFRLNNHLGGVNNATAILFSSENFNEDGKIEVQRDGALTAGIMKFFTKANNGASLERQRIDSSGNVGIGTSSPAAKLHVAMDTGTAPAIASDTGLIVSNLSAAGDSAALSLIAGATGYSTLNFGDTADENVGYVQYGHTNNYMAFGANTNEYMRITTSGNIGIGTTTPTQLLNIASPDAQFVLSDIDAAVNSKHATIRSSAGRMAFGYRNDALSSLTEALSIMSTDLVGVGTSSPSSKLSLTQNANTSAGGLWIAEVGNTDFRSAYMDTSGILSFYGGDTAGALNTATLNAAGAWTNASDKSYKENIVDLGTKYGLATVLKTQPRFYEMKGTHLPQVGFIAQELNELVPEVVDGKDGSMGISYGNLVAVAFQAIKELSVKVDSLAANGLSAVKALFVDDLEVKNKLTVAGEVCVDDICVTKEQFKKMLQKAGGEEKPKENNKPKEETPKPQENATTTATTTPEVIKEEPKEEVKPQETASSTPETVVEEPEKEEEKPKVEEPPKEEVKEEIKPVEEPKKEEPKVEEEKKEEPKSEETPQS